MQSKKSLILPKDKKQPTSWTATESAVEKEGKMAYATELFYTW